MILRGPSSSRARKRDIDPSYILAFTADWGELRHEDFVYSFLLSHNVHVPDAERPRSHCPLPLRRCVVRAQPRTGQPLRFFILAHGVPVPVKVPAPWHPPKEVPSEVLELFTEARGNSVAKEVIFPPVDKKIAHKRKKRGA